MIRTKLPVKYQRRLGLQSLISKSQTTSAIPHSSKVSSASVTSADHTFDAQDYKSAFKYRKTSELARSLLIFKLCSYPTVVKKSLKMMHVGQRVLGQRTFNRVMKTTFYGQFVGGEREDELRKTISMLHRSNIGAMLFVPVEEDGDQQAGQDDMYDNNLASILNCLSIAKSTDKKYPMSQIKLTALMPGKLCLGISKQVPDPLSNTKYIDAVIEAFDGNMEHLAPTFGDLSGPSLEKSILRLKAVGEYAESSGVRLLVDAEYTYLNPALRLLTLCMMLKYNKHRPLVAYTYQNYLKETYQNLKSDVEFIRSRNACFGAKLVRGAYLDKERQLASDGRYADPVHDCFEDTSNMYHASLQFLLDKIHDKPTKYSVIVASHNENTAQLAVKLLKDRDIDMDVGSVFFGQSYGMADHLSAALGAAGFRVYKSTPYGTVDDTLPYLHRRALENKSVLDGTRTDRDMIRKALINRTTFGKYPRGQ